MTDPNELKSRIDAARKAEAPPESRDTVTGHASGAAAALSHAAGMVVAVAIGAFIGTAIDNTFSTGPWALLIFLVFGMAAGFLNMIRAARKMAEDAVKAQAAQSAPDDDTSDGQHG